MMVKRFPLTNGLNRLKSSVISPAGEEWHGGDDVAASGFLPRMTNCGRCWLSNIYILSNIAYWVLNVGVSV